VMAAAAVAMVRRWRRVDECAADRWKAIDDGARLHDGVLVCMLCAARTARGTTNMTPTAAAVIGETTTKISLAAEK